jgi:hypothetical protein
MKQLNTSTLKKKLNQIESFIPKYETSKTNVSKVSVGWHLDHSLKVFNGVIITMKNSDVALYKNNFSFLGKVFLTLGYFPKGKAKAPKRVMPPEIIVKEDIVNQLDLARKNLNELQNFEVNTYFEHPMFGHINKKRIVRFLNTHTNHHLKIIKRILK